MVNEGKASLKAFCDASDYNYDEKLIDQILIKEKQLQEKLNISTKNVFRYPKVRLVLAKLAVAWFAASMLYYGIIFSTTPNVLLNNFLLGVLSALAGPMMCILMKSKFSNRRTLLGSLYIITGLSVLAMAIIANYKNNVASLIFGSVSYGVISGAFSLLFLYTSELLPTVIRSSVFGTLSGIARIGSMIGSQVLNLNTDERPWVAGLIFGIIALIAAGLIFTLPETRGEPLTQTLDEAEMAFTKSYEDSNTDDDRSDEKRDIV